MPFISSDQAERLAASTVRMALLAELRFRSRTMYLWNGVGIVAIGGVDWEGLGVMGSVDGLSQARTAESSKVTLRLSGVTPEMQALARNSVDDVQGRFAFLWSQLFDDAWQPVGSKIALHWGIMQRIGISRQPDGSSGGATRLCELEIENPFAGRARPPASRYTDADQQARHPGDKFCRFGPVQRGKTVTWPDY